MKLASFTINLAPQVTHAQPPQLAPRSRRVNTPFKVTMGRPPLTVTVATLALLALSAPCKLLALMGLTTSLVPPPICAQRVQPAPTVTKLSKLLVSLACIVISQLIQQTTNSALSAPTLLLVVITLLALSATVATLATSAE
jgi:hypothetical protein